MDSISASPQLFQYSVQHQTEKNFSPEIDQQHDWLSNVTGAEYCEAFGDLDMTSDHIHLLTDFIKTEVLSKHHYRTFLDVGAGPGYITERLIGSFEEATVLDPNQDYLPLYETINQRKPLKILINNFETAELDRQYDFILLSHMLYYIPQKNWSEFAHKVISTLNPGGKALVTIIAPRGPYHELCQSVKKEYSHSEKLTPILDQEGIAYEISEKICTYHSKDRSTMFDLTRICVLDDCFSPQEYDELSDEKKADIETKINQYIDSNLQTDGFYVFKPVEEYILMSNS